MQRLKDIERRLDHIESYLRTQREAREKTARVIDALDRIHDRLVLGAPSVRLFASSGGGQGGSGLRQQGGSGGNGASNQRLPETDTFVPRQEEAAPAEAVVAQLKEDPAFANDRSPCRIGGDSVHALGRVGGYRLRALRSFASRCIDELIEFFRRQFRKFHSRSPG